MRFFILQSVLWFAAIPLLVSGAEPYWASPVVVSEMAPIRIEETTMSSDGHFLFEPQIIERRILSTRVISPLPATEKVRAERLVQNPEPLEPLRWDASEETPVLKNKNSDNAELVKPSEIVPVSLTTESESAKKPFQKIEFPLDETSNQTTVMKPAPEEISATSEPRQPPPAPLILGQSPMSIAGAVEEALKEPPPYPQGPVDPSIIDPKLTESTATSDGLQSEIDAAAVVTMPAKPETDKPGETGAKREKWADGALLLLAIVAILFMVYAVVMMFDYRQRWMQSLLAQNNRFGSFDEEMEGNYSEDMYGASYGTGSDTLGLRRFSPDMFESPVNY